MSHSLNALLWDASPLLVLLVFLAGADLVDAGRGRYGLPFLSRAFGGRSPVMAGLQQGREGAGGISDSMEPEESATPDGQVDLREILTDVLRAWMWEGAQGDGVYEDLIPLRNKAAELCNVAVWPPASDRELAAIVDKYAPRAD